MPHAGVYVDLRGKTDDLRDRPIDLSGNWYHLRESLYHLSKSQLTLKFLNRQLTNRNFWNIMCLLNKEGMMFKNEVLNPFSCWFLDLVNLEDRISMLIFKPFFMNHLHVSIRRNCCPLSRF